MIVYRSFLLCLTHSFNKLKERNISPHQMFMSCPLLPIAHNAGGSGPAHNDLFSPSLLSSFASRHLIVMVLLISKSRLTSRFAVSRQDPLWRSCRLTELHKTTAALNNIILFHFIILFSWNKSGFSSGDAKPGKSLHNRWTFFTFSHFTTINVINSVV